MPAGNIDLIQAVLYFFRGLQVCLGDDLIPMIAFIGVRISWDMEEKVCLGVTRDLGRLESVLQSLPLTGLLVRSAVTSAPTL